MNKIAPIPKFAMLGVYAVAFASPFIPFMAGISAYLVGFGVLVLVVHVVEYFLYRERLAAKAPEDSHLLPVLLYGILYIRPVLRA